MVYFFSWGSTADCSVSLPPPARTQSNPFVGKRSRSMRAPAVSSVGNALERGFHLLARGDQIVPCYQATGGAARRSWAEKHRDVLVSYIRATIEATRWCFEPANRSQAIELLGKHNGIHRQAAENTLDALLDPGYGIYPEAELNLSGVEAALELRAEMGFLNRPLPPVEKYVDLSYYREAVEE